MTVVPCLADQPRHTGQPRQTGALPESQEGAVLVRAHRREPADGLEREAIQPPRVADLGEIAPAEPDDATATAAVPTAASSTGAAKTGEAASNAAASDATDAPRAAVADEAADVAESAGPSRSAEAAASAGPGSSAEVAESAERGRSADAAESADPSRSADAAEPANPSRPAEPARSDPEHPDVHPDPEHPSRVRVVVDWDLFTRPPRRVATREEMLASAHRVLARRKHGRHRKPETREPWASRAADFVVAWAATLRMALLLLAGTAFLTGLVLMNSPIAGVAVTSVVLAAGVAAWVARPRRSPSHRC
ncbi:hypothetical protein [Amycolatopsis silviterrae]|uniref:DUF3040 domain-containing protein n=1 Tax=Amycolatopsis silviterrae TaxID=1656914 RepID=A0ABW5H7P5_9PSEU